MNVLPKSMVWILRYGRIRRLIRPAILFLSVRRMPMRWMPSARNIRQRSMTKDRKPSVLAQLSKFKNLVASVPKKIREKKQERDL